MLRLTDFDAFTFDVYGTLIDWEPGIIAFLQAWAARHGLHQSDEALLMAYDRARAVIQLERPAHLYPEILRRSFDSICANFGVAPDPATRAAFGESPKTWPPYADTQAGLRALQRQGKLAALSNIDENSFRATTAKLGIGFDLVVTAERVGAYKPDWPHFHTALAELQAMGIAPARILHIAQSLRADIAPANALGLRCVWVRRPGRLLGLSGGGAAEARPDATVESLAELVALLSDA